MVGFLTFVGLLSIVLFIKFLYDTYVKGERYSLTGQRLPSNDKDSASQIKEHDDELSKQYKQVSKYKINIMS